MRERRLRFAPAAVESVLLEGGGIVLRSPLPLGPYARCAGDWLEQWAAHSPEQDFLVEREPGGGPRRVTYRGAREAVRGAGQALLELGLGPLRPLLLLSDNSIDHALLQLGAMHAGVPVAPIPPAWSLVSHDHHRLRSVAARLEPGAVYAGDGEPYARALATVDDAVGREVIRLHSTRTATPASIAATQLFSTRSGPRLDEAFARLSPDSIAKILFTSGSTGWPKGVINTHRMLCSNQQAIAEVWRFLDEKPPVLVDWLPWSHTFGGNHNFNLALRNGGTLHVDHGKPVPGGGPGTIGETVALLGEVAPTLYFNVPRGFEVLLPFLEQDEALCRRFFSRLDVLFYAAAALPQNLWRRLAHVAERSGGPGAAFLSAWGSTETAPLTTTVHFHIERAGVIGLPAPGCQLKLWPDEDTLEMRVRGPNVTPGYWERGGQLVPLELDEEGFFRTGDAARLEDPFAPEKGVVFEGRIAENFKLSTGIWVSTGEVRLGVIAAAAPLVQDAAITGHDQRFLGLLLFPNLAACRLLVGDSEAARSPAELVAHPLVRTRLRAKLDDYNYKNPSSSTRVSRVLLLAEPPSIDGGEITDKGYLNQRAVLTRRAALVARLHADAPDPEVIDLFEETAP